jgi:hypothetical protein
MVRRQKSGAQITNVMEYFELPIDDLQLTSSSQHSAISIQPVKDGIHDLPMQSSTCRK